MCLVLFCTQLPGFPASIVAILTPVGGDSQSRKARTRHSLHELLLLTFHTPNTWTWSGPFFDQRAQVESPRFSDCRCVCWLQMKEEIMHSGILWTVIEQYWTSTQDIATSPRTRASQGSELAGAQNQVHRGRAFAVTSGQRSWDFAAISVHSRHSASAPLCCQAARSRCVPNALQLEPWSTPIDKQQRQDA